ncbi:BON domain-containing protein [Curtobacterium flaccumfaciens]|uniref:BON domain-containing protein n=1 Tax=Curtobacterium flaccumfaciens TaxID=2035 RepID=UPI00188B2C10|nr:BON domain-containing protein [Curtobacterium flaccumfaciens]MBF4628354.1 BON domain-containing protein [Curtobacterium flaccumfaciens]
MHRPLLTAHTVDTVTERWFTSAALDATGLIASLRIDEERIVLSGDTGCHAERTLALEIAEEVAGSGAVRNEITIRPLRVGADDTDGTVTARAAAALDALPGGDAITVTVLDHVATLHGVVPDVATRVASHAAVARTEGVHFVDNRVTVDDRPAL